MMTMMIGLYVYKWLDVGRKEPFFLISVESVVRKNGLVKVMVTETFSQMATRLPGVCAM